MTASRAPWPLVQAAVAVLLLAADGAAAAPADPTGDLAHLRPLIDQTLETEKSGVEIRWSNPETGHGGMMRVERTFFRDERPCRDYLRTVARPGESGFVIRGTACRAGRGEWDILDEVVTEKDAPKKRSPTARPALQPDAPSPAGPAAGASSGRAQPAAHPEPASEAAGGAPPARAAEPPAPAEEESARGTARSVPFTLPSRSAL